jgi:hypothetical protein
LRTRAQQAARQAAGAGADFKYGGVGGKRGGARDLVGDVEVEQEILAEPLVGPQIMAGDDVTQRRQAVQVFFAGPAQARCSMKAAALRSIR